MNCLGSVNLCGKHIRKRSDFLRLDVRMSGAFSRSDPVTRYGITRPRAVGPGG